MKLSPAKLRFYKYLQFTLIPDLEESGSYFTADDFKMGIIFFTTDADKVFFVNYQGSQYSYTRDSFIDYLDDTLIPDLIDSGKTETATDFRTLIRFITH